MTARARSITLGCVYDVGDEEGAIDCENTIRPGSIVRAKRRSQASQLHLYSASASDGRLVVSGRVACTELTLLKTYSVRSLTLLIPSKQDG